MFSAIQKWGSFVRFSHTVFALPFALAAMVCARTCAMAFNRIVDRKFDALNPRTAKRHLPAGQISLASATLLCALAAAGLEVAS
jgi:4-hydroxybenzoate polyprenyltransferase